MKKSNLIRVWSSAVPFRWGMWLYMALIAFGLSSVSAQDNPIPLNWRNLNVQVIETYGNNFTKPLLGAKVTIELKDPHKADALRQQYPTLQLPQTRTAQTTGVSFRQLPPSQVVGPYIVTVDPKPNDINKEYICEERTKKAAREIRMGGGADQRLNFNFECNQADAVNEFDRRAQGGYNLTIELKESGGTRGNGLWVHVYDKNGNRIKKVRTGGTATAVFANLDPSYGPFKIEVYKGIQLVNTSTYQMPPQSSTFTINLDANGAGAAVGGGGSYDLTVKLDLWVHVYDKYGKLVKKERPDNSSMAKFSGLNSENGPYKIEVYSSNKLLYTTAYEMPNRHTTYVVN